MILILSHNYIDEPTNNIIDWLYFYNAKYKRINGDEYTPSNNFTLDLSKNTLSKNGGKEVNPDDVSVVWYRRWFGPPTIGVDFNDYVRNSFTEHEILLIESYQVFLK